MYCVCVVQVWLNMLMYKHNGQYHEDILKYSL